MILFLFSQDFFVSSPASRSQEGLEEGPGLGLNRNLNVTLLTSEWQLSKDGVVTLNRELAIQFAKHPDIRVSVYLPQCSENDKKDASSHNVQLIQAEELTGFDPIDWLSEAPANHVMDCVIGHGVLLGRYAQIFKRRHQCKLWIQVVHTAHEELMKYKTCADAISKGMKKHEEEVKLCEKADLVVTFGPKLKELFSRYLRYCQKDQAVINITPSIFPEFPPVKQSTEERETFYVLVLGRGNSCEDFQLKGYDIVAKAIAFLGSPFHLMFVGAHSGKEDEVTKWLHNLGINRNQFTVRCFHENREELAKLFCEADLATLPSRTEGFGLVALEALSAGLPVLVSGNSGVGEALKKVPHGSQWVVDSECPEDWANAIRSVRKKDRELRLEETKLLSETYAEQFSWDEQCNLFVEMMRKITPGNFCYVLCL